MRRQVCRGPLAAARKVILSASALLALLAVPAAMQGQTVTMYGALSNFDVINDTGEPAHGFEIEIHGITSIGGAFTWNRYGATQITPFADGVYVRYLSAWDPASQTFVVSTPVAVHPTATNGHQCVLGTFGYDTSGCEHFGVWTYGNPTQVIYRWMIADPANPGQLKTSGSLVAIPAPVWTIQPPLQPAAPVVIAAQVDPPIPPPPAKLFGAAQWMKTFKTENGRQVGLDELVADNPVVPQDLAHQETAWDLVQSELGSNSRRKQKRGALGGGSHAVVRRFEFYKFAGTYDPITGQAICADGLCNAPADSEIGDFIGAQNGAINLNVPAQYTVTVNVIGDGAVSSSDRVISCPSRMHDVGASAYHGDSDGESRQGSILGLDRPLHRERPYLHDHGGFRGVHDHHVPDQLQAGREVFRTGNGDLQSGRHQLQSRHGGDSDGDTRRRLQLYGMDRRLQPARRSPARSRSMQTQR